MTRLRFASRIALTHLLVSLIIALFVAALVVLIWYPTPYRQILSINFILILMVCVNTICGPMLSLVLMSPKKRLLELRVDLGMVGVVQVVILCCSLWLIFMVRPVIVAFDKDRLVIVTANEIQYDELMQAPEALRDIPFFNRQFVGLRAPKDGHEFVESTLQQLSGLGPAQRPSWWLPWVDAMPNMMQKSRPLSDLMAARPQQRPILTRAISKTGIAIKSLRFIPITAAETWDWVVFLDVAGQIVGYANVDGFIEADSKLFYDNSGLDY